MLIHTYFTDGFYGFGKLFIESFKKIHGEKDTIIATTRDLNDRNISNLEKIYKNLIVLNKNIDMSNLSKKSGFSVGKLKKLKKEIEFYKVHGAKENVLWKQFISVEDRYRNSIMEAMEYNHGEKHMMHIDADSYIRKPLYPLFDIIENNDVSLIFRLYRKKDVKKIFGTLSGYAINSKSKMFMNKWKEVIDRIPLKNKPRGYGQSSCYYAYNELKDQNIKWGEIKEKYVSSHLKDDLLIWSGNHSRGKTKTIELFEKDFNK